MKKLLVTILSLCILLIGCTHTESNSIETDFLSDELILQEQISPNKEYVTEEKDIVYYTVEVYQNDDNTIIVNTSSNSGFFKPIQYTVNYDKAAGTGILGKTAGKPVQRGGQASFFMPPSGFGVLPRRKKG